MSARKFQINIKGGWHGYYPGQDGKPIEGKVGHGNQVITNDALAAFLEAQPWAIGLVGNAEPTKPVDVVQEPEPAPKEKGKASSR